jgi:hypothetical protein
MQRDGTDKAANKIASRLYSLFREKEIKADEQIVVCYSEMATGWAFNAFSALGENSKRTGFASDIVLLIHTIVTDRLNRHKDDKWKKDNEFGFQDSCVEI